jgi:hypothetical protein
VTPHGPDKPPFRWSVFWIGVAIIFVVLAALSAWNPLGLFSSL